MSIDVSGRDAKVESASVTIFVPTVHPLIQLASMIPWALLIDMVVEDLKKTTPKGCWWLGRKIRVRIHLAAYLLAKLYNLTDRQVEYGIKDNAAYQLFSGSNIVAGWRPPDHTKIEEFRNRLSPETQRKIANEMAKVAVDLGFGDASETDIDSTVQEANMSYPADVNIMTKLVGMGRKVIDYLKEKTRGIVPGGWRVDLKGAKELARNYLFLSKNTDIEKRRSLFKNLHSHVKKAVRPVVETCSNLDQTRIAKMPWNIRQTFDRIRTDAWRYLLDVGHFIRTHSIKPGKILSFHAREVACIKKGKVGKDKEFGRVFQLGRIKGNFLFVLGCNSLHMEDKNCLIPLVKEHADLFGQGTLKSIAADKGYWKVTNQKALIQSNVEEIGLQRPNNTKYAEQLPTQEVQDRLRDRRAGIEPMIGHAKHGGQLGKSRMKSDTATLAAGYSSILGLNLRQLIRHRAGKMGDKRC